MSSLEANKEFGRVGSIVRVSDGSAADPTRRSVEDEEASNERRRGGTTEVREAVAGLSRGDVVRLKARQRLAAASKNLSGLLELPSRSTASVPGPSSNPNVARERQGQAPHQSTSPRYEIEVPSWVKSAKYTAAMQPWLEEASATRQESLQRVSRSKQRYHESRDRVMQVSAATTSTARRKVEILQGKSTMADGSCGASERNGRLCGAKHQSKATMVRHQRIESDRCQ